MKGVLHMKTMKNKKTRYQFYVTDWAPNGTNGLVIRYSDGRQADYRDEALFGVDITKLGPAKYFESHFESPEYRISRKLLKKHVASGPFGMGFEDNCRWLSKYL